MSSLGDQIRSQAPHNAHFFQLSVVTAAGNIRTIPAHGGLFQMHAPLPELAPGRYSVLYYDRSTERINKPVMVEVHAGMGNDQLMLLYEQEKRAASGAASPDPPTDPTAEGDEAEDAPGDEDAPAREAAGLTRKGYARMTRLRLEVERETQGIIAQAAHTREIGETHQLNGLMRREFVELHRHITANAVAQLEAVKNERSDFLKHRLEFDEALTKVRARYEERIAQLPIAPPPPRDYSNELCKLIDAAQNITLAFMASGGDGAPRKPKRLAASPKPSAEASDVASQSAEKQPPEVPEAPSPPDAPPAPAGDPGLLARFKTQLANMSEAQLTMFLMNPTAVLDALTQSAGDPTKRVDR